MRTERVHAHDFNGRSHLKKRRKALSVSATPSQLSQRESQGRFFDSPRKDEPSPIKARHLPRYVIPTVALAEWRNPPRSRNVPMQSKICHLGRFLDSLHSRNDISGGGFAFSPQAKHPTWRADDSRWNYGVIAPGNQ